LFVNPVFRDAAGNDGELIPRSTAEELAAAIVQCVEAGVHVLNLSLALAGPSPRGQRALAEALDLTMQRGTVVVAAAGNQGEIGSSIITRHPWVIPVAACTFSGQPLDHSNLGASVGKRGLGAPGHRVVSITPTGDEGEWTGTSVATPFVTGTIALLWSEFPSASAAAVRSAVTLAQRRRHSISPPLLDAWAAYHLIQKLL
jgi:subtilisin family serine protease